MLPRRLQPAPSYAQQKFVTFGTGGVTGVYYAVGGAICRLVNKDRKTTASAARWNSTGGSAFNVNTIKGGELDFGMAQSDVQYQALEGREVLQGRRRLRGPARGVLGASGAVHGAVAQGSERHQIRGLQGQALQRRQSGLRHARLDGRAADADGLEDRPTSRSPRELKADEHGPALCDNKIDGFFYGVGHPSANIQDPTTTCGAKLVSLTGPAVDKLIKENSYYAKATIPGGMYSNNPNPTETYGVLATLVTSAKVPDDVVYNRREGDLRQFRGVQEAAPGLRQSRARQHGQGRPVGAAASGRGEVLQGKRLDQVSGLAHAMTSMRRGT